MDNMSNIPVVYTYNPEEELGFHPGTGVHFDSGNFFYTNQGFFKSQTWGLKVSFNHGLPVIDAELTEGNQYLLVYHNGMNSRTIYGDIPVFEIKGLKHLVSKSVDVLNFDNGRLTEDFGYTVFFKIEDADWECKWYIQCPYTSVIKDFYLTADGEGPKAIPIRAKY